jgi:tetratricopeptide (TPR) repeat protein
VTRTMRTKIAFLTMAIAAALVGDAPSQTLDARRQLIAAKTALYDGNFRNDQAGMKAAVAHALDASQHEPLRAMALYYAAWGEWAIAHSQMQAGDLTGASASLGRAEQHARAGLQSRPNDPEFVLMLANALIWRIVAEPTRVAQIGSEVRKLRAKVLELAPDNPRVVIMDAGLIFNNPPERGGSREQGLARWQHALDLFEREATLAADDELRPDWGRALAYAWVADLYLAMRPRQVEEAREAARRALQLSPDFWYVTDVVMPRLK